MELEEKVWELADKLLLKIEAPTRQEVEDQVRDGNPVPVWVLKERLPTHAIAYFDKPQELHEFLIKLQTKRIKHDEST